MLKACESVDMQTCEDWEHIVVVDTPIRGDILNRIAHPRRRIVYCDEQHNDYGHTCRHLAYKYCSGDYIYNLDDDNYLADEKVLEDLQVVNSQWALFPISRLGEKMFQYPPTRGLVDTGSVLVKREIGQWPKDSDYFADWNYVKNLYNNYPCQSLDFERPLMVMPISMYGGTGSVSTNVKVSIFTPTHTSQFLRDAYDSIKNQDFYEWIVVYNNGAVPLEFNDPRVKSHVLYKAPEKVGALKAFACEQASGDVLLELDHDDLLSPDAIKEVQAAFTDPEVGFVYSNVIHCFTDFSKYPRYTELHGWKFREVEFLGHKLDEFISFPPTPESVSRIWYAPDHLRAFRLGIYRAVGGYDKSLKVLDDGDLMCKMYLHTKFKHIDKPLYVYRVHGQNSWLRFNKEIQDGVYPIYDKYIKRMAEKWALDNNLLVARDIQDISPLKDNSVGVLYADNLAMVADSIALMKEISRVLVPGGMAFCYVPSTDGRGAWQDPRHVSFWNENSFLYYTHRNWAQYINAPVRFQATRLYTTEKDVNQVCWVVAHLVNMKGGYRPPGLIEI